MTEREKIKERINAKHQLIRHLNREIIELRKEALLLSDEEQWFTEKEEEFVVSRRPKVTEKQLVGRIHWNEEFKDEDTGKSIFIERSEVVRIDGVWADNALSF